jgi:hypothetical protein
MCQLVMNWTGGQNASEQLVTVLCQWLNSWVGSCYKVYKGIPRAFWLSYSYSVMPLVS